MKIEVHQSRTNEDDVWAEVSPLGCVLCGDVPLGIACSECRDLLRWMRSKTASVAAMVHAAAREYATDDGRDPDVLAELARLAVRLHAVERR